MELCSHPLKTRLLILLFFLVAFVAIRIERTADDYAGALPISVTLPDLTPQEAEQVQVVCVSPKDFQLVVKPSNTPNTWALSYYFWARAIRLYFPEDLLTRSHPVTITIAGEYTFKTDTKTLCTQWKPVPTSAGYRGFESPSSLSAPHLPFLPSVINGPTDTPFVTIGLQAFTLLLVGGALIFLSMRIRTGTPLFVWLNKGLDERPPLPVTRSQTYFYAIVGFVILLGSLALLVRGERYGFVHDDNITQFFPTLLQGCQSLEKGIFPTYNPYQLMGSPTASVGVYALTYPLTYLSYAVATHVLHDPYTTLDVFAILHLALGYLATFRLARTAGLRPALALCASLSFVLCGYFVVYTRGWFYMAPVALWSPLLFSEIYKTTQDKPLDLPWVGRTAGIVGVYFHAGNAQMWSYTLVMATCLVATLAYARRIPSQRLLWLIPPVLLGLALAAPLLVVQSAEVANIDRAADFKQGILKGVLSLFLPTPLTDAPHPLIQPGLDDLWKHLYHFAPLYFCGPVFLTLALVALLTLPFFTWGRERVGSNPWIFCLAIALLLSMGEDGGLAQILAHLPVFNKFQHWWKFLPFVALSSAIGGGSILERLLQRRTSAIPERALAIAIPALLAYNAYCSIPVISIATKPYPALPRELKDLILNSNEPLHRGLTLAPWKQDTTGFVLSMAQNFSTLYEFPMLEGYDPLVEASPLNLRIHNQVFPSGILGRAPDRFTPGLPPTLVEVLHRYGVRWIFVTDATLSGEKMLLIRALRDHLRVRYEMPSMKACELAGSDPLAFPEGKPTMALPLTLNASGVAVDLQGQHGPVVVNFLARERLHAFVDGTPTPAQPDSWNRVRVEVPAGAKTLTLRYEPDWHKGFVLGGILIALAVGILVRLYPLRPVKAIPLTK